LIAPGNHPNLTINPDDGTLYAAIYKTGENKSILKPQDQILIYSSSDQGDTWGQKGAVSTVKTLGAWGSYLTFDAGNSFHWKKDLRRLAGSKRKTAAGIFCLIQKRGAFLGERDLPGKIFRNPPFRQQ